MTRADMTRNRLQEEAIRLFAEKGFDNVTVEQVASAAGVSHMTFFRHFPTKESAVLEDPYDPLIGAKIRSQPRRLSALERTRRGLLASWEQLPQPDEEATRIRTAIAAGHPGLRARMWENNHQTEEVIVDALIATGAAPLEARVAAGATLGAITAALIDWAADEDSESLGERLQRTLDLLAPGS